MQSLRNVVRFTAIVVAVMVVLLLVGQYIALSTVYQDGLTELQTQGDAARQQAALTSAAEHMSASFARAIQDTHAHYALQLAACAQALTHAPEHPPAAAFAEDVTWLLFAADGTLTASGGTVPDALAGAGLAQAEAWTDGLSLRYHQTLPDGASALLFVTEDAWRAAQERVATHVLDTWPGDEVTLITQLSDISLGAQLLPIYQRKIAPRAPVVYGYQVPMEPSTDLGITLPVRDMTALQERGSLLISNVGIAGTLSDMTAQPCAIVLLPDTTLTVSVSARLLQADSMTHPAFGPFRQLCYTIYFATAGICVLCVAALAFHLITTYRRGKAALVQAEAEMVAREETIQDERNQIDRIYEELRRLGALTPRPGMHNQASIVHWLDANFESFHRISSEALLGGERATAILLLSMDDVEALYALPYGHDIVDSILSLMGPLFEQRTRKNDLVARWHDASFLIILSHISLKDALMRAETLRACVANTEFDAEGGRRSVTVTCGLSMMLASDSSWRQAVERTKKAVQRSKDGGKNTLYHEIL